MSDFINNCEDCDSFGVRFCTKHNGQSQRSEMSDSRPTATPADLSELRQMAGVDPDPRIAHINHLLDCKLRLQERWEESPFWTDERHQMWNDRIDTLLSDLRRK